MKEAFSSLSSHHQGREDKSVNYVYKEPYKRGNIIPNGLFLPELLLPTLQGTAKYFQVAIKNGSPERAYQHILESVSTHLW
jgi:hypothetical protein